MQFLHRLHRCFRRHRAVRIALALPHFRYKDGRKVPPNFELQNDKVAFVPILTLDAEGTPVAAPTGDTFSVSSSSPASLLATIATVNGAVGVSLTPQVQASPNLTVTVTDSDGLSSYAQLVDIVADTTPKAISLDVADATFTAQPEPTAPGP